MGLFKAAASALYKFHDAMDTGVYVNGRMLSRYELGKMRAEEERIKREATIENEHRRRALANGGIDVGLLTDDLLTSNAIAIANGMCHARIRKDAPASRVDFRWGNLTKTGKLPKCVLTAHVIFDYKNGDSVVIRMSYGRNCEPYSADVNIWHSDEQWSYKVRMVDGKLAVVSNPEDSE